MSLKNKILLLLTPILYYFLVNLIIVGLFLNKLNNLKTSLLALDIDNSRYQVNISMKYLNLIKYTSLGFINIPKVNKIYLLIDHSLITVIKTLDVIDIFKQNIVDKNFSVKSQQLDDFNLKISAVNNSFKILINDLEDPFIESFLNTFVKNIDSDKILFLKKVSNYINILDEFKNNLPIVLGFKSPQRYRVIMQNNMELRPTGGFMGSYLELVLDNGRLMDFSVSDIYEPDGQLIKGYVNQPQPIKDYLFDGQHPGWRLRDANWAVDFPEATKTIDWFFIKAGYPSADVYIAINLIPIIDIIRLIEPINIPDYNLQISTDNFYTITQYQAEHNFFPGSTQKQDFLNSVIKSLLIKLSSDWDSYFLNILDILFNNINQNQILISSNNKSLNRFLNKRQWDGSVLFNQCKDKYCVSDFLYINEANLGVNKANCCIDRKVELSLYKDNNIFKHYLKIDYKNNNPKKKKPPVSWGDTYENYLRIYLPKDINIHKVLFNSKKIAYDVNSLYGKTELGCFLEIHGQDDGILEVFYSIPYINANFSKVNLLIQKQSGINSIPFILNYPDNWSVTPIDNIENHFFDLIKNTKIDFILDSK